jgi:uncharacterized protein YcbK (DUF882 family)
MSYTTPATSIALPSPSRRGFLRQAAGCAIVGAAGAGIVRPVFAAEPSRLLSFDHTHTREKLSLVYAAGGQYVNDALSKLNRFLRDHYTGDVGSMDPQLFDLLFKVRSELKCSQPFQVISGYRCPATNNNLRGSRGGGVAKRSLHMEGKAIDIRIPGVPLKEVRDAALALKGGGVGYYPGDQFVHLDTGRVRSW